MTKKNSRKPICKILNFKNILLILILAILSTSVCFACTYPTFKDSLNKIAPCKYDSFNSEKIDYTPKFSSEYWNYLPTESKIYYDAIADFNGTKEYLYCYNDNNYHNDDWDRAMEFYLLDHPEIELQGYEIYGSINTSNSNENYQIIEISPCEYSYTSTKNRYYRPIDNKSYQDYINEIDTEISNLVNQVNSTNDITQKYKLIYNWITKNVNYDYDSCNYILENNEIKEGNSQNLYGAIVEKLAVCDGISDGFKYICNKCNLECITVTGTVTNNNGQNMYHQWNIVPVNNNWYLIDCTYGLCNLRNGNCFGNSYKNNLYFMSSNLNIDNRQSIYCIEDNNSETILYAKGF